MGSRRGQGEGSIYYRKDRECWCAMVNLGGDGSTRKRKAIFGKTRREVADKLKAVLHDHQQGRPGVVERRTGEFRGCKIGGVNGRSHPYQSSHDRDCGKKGT